MLRARFRTDVNDPRPVVWPIQHPWWCTGFTDDHSIVVAYVDDEQELLKLWPDASQIDSEPADAYFFSDRFPEPGWFKAMKGCAKDENP